MQDNHVLTGNLVKNEIISDGHHPVLKIVDGKGETFREIFQRKTSGIEFFEEISSGIRACGLACNERLYFAEIMVASRRKNDTETHRERRSFICADVKKSPLR
jgi:hypothetical protein